MRRDLVSLLAGLSLSAAAMPAGLPGQALAQGGPLGEGASGSPLVAAAGDIACDPADDNFNGGAGKARNCRQRHTAALVRSIDPQAVLALGDLQYEFGTLENFRRSYDPTWGTFKQRTFATAGGRHDFHGGGEWYDYLGDRAGPEPYAPYSFDLGSWHLISLNSSCSHERVSCGPGSEQQAWLRDDLVRSQGRCLLAFWHEPRWASGDPRGGATTVDAFVRDLHAARADLVLSGHQHHYERFAPQDPDGRRDDEAGIVQFVVGTGGESLQRFRGALPNSVARSDDSFGVLVLRLHSSSYEWAFVREDGTYADYGSRRCNSQPSAPAARTRIRLSARPRRIRAGSRRVVRFRATAPLGQLRVPVRNATVRFARRSARTDDDGYATLEVRVRVPRLLRARASVQGMRTGTTRVRILRPRR